MAKSTRPEQARRYRCSVAEIADEYGVHPRTVRRWLAEGRISGHRIGPRVIRLDPDEVAAQLLSNPMGAAV